VHGFTGPNGGIGLNDRKASNEIPSTSDLRPSIGRFVRHLNLEELENVLQLMTDRFDHVVGWPSL
jgi:hypothetical protein